MFLIGITRGDAMLGNGISEAACFSQTPLKLLAFPEKNAVRFPRNTLHCAAYQTTVRNIKEDCAGLYRPRHPHIVFNDLPKVENFKRLFPNTYLGQPVMVSSTATR